MRSQGTSYVSLATILLCDPRKHLPAWASSPMSWRGSIGVCQRPLLEFFNFLTHVDVKCVKMLK